MTGPADVPGGTKAELERLTGAIGALNVRVQKLDDRIARLERDLASNIASAFVKVIGPWQFLMIMIVGCVWIAVGLARLVETIIRYAELTH